MLTLEYYVTERGKNEILERESLLDMHENAPAWFAQLPNPDFTAPYQQWAPLAGDAEHVIHITGTVSYWYQGPDFVHDLVAQRGLTKTHAERLRQMHAQYPAEKYVWAVYAESRNCNRVPKTDPDYQKQLAITIDGDRS